MKSLLILTLGHLYALFVLIVWACSIVGILVGIFSNSFAAFIVSLIVFLITYAL